ncbi:MAG: tetratricopeptide repeat protein [Acidobacteria bacterium]|nr:tetratricopeptide repeat protein [Acidobacteriota bacterium]
MIAAKKESFKQFEKYIEEGKLTEVEKPLFDYVVANPKDAEGFFLLAKLRLRQTRLSEARSLFKKTLTLDANLTLAKIELASTDLELGEAEEAQTLLNGINESEIKNDAVRLRLATVYADAGDCANALKNVESLPLKIKNREALPLRGACYLELGDNDNFSSSILIANGLSKQDQAVALKFAEVLSKRGLHKETSELLNTIVLYVPQNLEALLLLAKSEILLKDFPHAKIHLLQAERIGPNSPELLFIKSLLESEQGNNAAALQLLQKCLALNPNTVRFLAQLVVVAMRANQAGEAVRAAEHLLDLQPANLEFLYLHGAASLQNNNLQKAEVSLTKFLESRPKDSRGCLALGLAYAAQPAKLEEARSQLRQCLAIDPNNYEAAYQMGLSYKTVGESAKALEYFEQTVKLSPGYASALRDLGAVYLQTGEEVKARPYLEKAVLLGPDDADTHFQLSRLYNLIGERDLGKKHLEIFQKLKNRKNGGM